MRRAVVAAILLVGASARADRTMSVWLGVTLDERSASSSFSSAGSSTDTSMNAGARLTLSFDDLPPTIPAPEDVAFSSRLVPELLAGFVADDVRAEGYIGAGVRLEGWMASHRRGSAMRTAIYLAARAIAIGQYQDGAGELAFGQYLLTARNGAFGWEGGAMLRLRNEVAADESRELDALLTIFVGWR